MHVLSRVISVFHHLEIYYVQVVSCVLSLDGKIDPFIMAVNATSAALMSSSIRWEGPIGAVQIGRILGKLIVNPSLDEVKFMYCC